MRFPNRLFSCAPAALLLLLLSTCQGDSDVSKVEAARLPERPNVLWIVCEDMSPLIAAFGDSTIQTPNLSRLAARGVRFPNTFSVAGVCAPSRFAIATGVYPISGGGHHMRTQGNEERLRELGLPGAYGALVDPEVKMMSQVLRENGYFTTNNAKTDYQFQAPKTAWDENGPRAHWRHRPPGQPFFSIFNLEITHESQVWQTSKGNLRFRPGFENDTSTIYGWEDIYTGADRPEPQIPPDVNFPLPPYLADTEATREDVRRVYDNIRIMDRQVGFLLDQLEADGLTDSTIIFWYSDHGGPLPRQKRLLYDSGLRVPMIVAWPDDRRAGEIDSLLFSFVDFAPSVFSMTGIEPPEWLQGQATFGEYQADERAYVFGASDRLDEHYDRIRAARDHRFKYLRNYYPERGYYLPLAYREQMASMQELLRKRDEGSLTDAQAQWFRDRKSTEELFDTWNDGYELENLAGRAEYQDKLVELRNATDAWLQRVGDLGGEPEVEMVQRFWNGADEMPVTGRPQLRRDSIGRFILESKTPGAQIAYRILPEDADREGWRVYTEPIEFDLDSGDTLRAVAQRIGFRESGISEGW
ncbi:arylsulfatase A-like enzyme [Neolewinella xylanilytica]|uniref:Arylsulfatase A-like enzyme n=1 Tax=Neolewinella xylanilytica TaxID=1514080 RepID=A0A2S6IAR2_9BACT|nr:sulfatase [Neolewinella xylanilytica]PPK88593.1 arylsulfatase A-like enzyme [Neolewinella xylanilytica]